MKANEELAEYAHNAWSEWMKYLFLKCSQNEDGSVTIPSSAVERWKRLMNTKYIDLPENEKENDRTEALKIQEIFIGKEFYY